MSKQARWADIIDLLADPLDHSRLSHDPATDSLVSVSGNRYEIRNGQPILIHPYTRFSRGWAFPPVEAGQQSTIRVKRNRPRQLAMRLRDKLRSTGHRDEIIARLRKDLTAKRAKTGEPPTIVIVGGGTIGDGSEQLLLLESVRVVAFDVYSSSNTTFVADGHQQPLADGSIDAVWIQAVLEHVVEPQVVVDEIARVLCTNGFVYAETPFMQPVHEGPYDFVRYTHSGHRLMFSAFEEVVSGPLGGPGQLVGLAARGLVGGITRSPLASKLAYAALSWLILLDRTLPTTWRTDFATGTYFLGRKAVQDLQPFDAPAYYRGAQ